jgi:hypothetical protein
MPSKTLYLIGYSCTASYSWDLVNDDKPDAPGYAHNTADHHRNANAEGV